MAGTQEQEAGARPAVGGAAAAAAGEGDEEEEEGRARAISILTAPQYASWAAKRGFRHRKLFRRRWIVLEGRTLQYFSAPPGDPDHELLGSTTLTHETTLDDQDVEGHPMGFTIVPSPTEDPWHLRAESMHEKRVWLNQLTQVQAIARWLDNYVKRQVIGVGATGVVREYVDKRTGARYALKEIEIANKTQRQHALREVEILKSVAEVVRHPNLIGIEKVFQEGNKLSIVFQLCTGGELYERIVRRGHYSEKDASIVMRKIVSALQALHQHNILHLDIKPENILFASEADDAEVVITDFGLSRFFTVGPGEDPARAPMRRMSTTPDSTLFKNAGIIQKERLCGTVGYMSPEVVVSREYGAPADVWAAGVILFILLVGYPPFYSPSDREILEKSARGDYEMRPRDWDKISDNAKDLVRRMLTVNPRERITTAEILEHPWIVGETVPEVPLADTRQRMERFNTQRRSKKASLKLSMIRSHLSTFGWTGEQLLGLEQLLQEHDSSSMSPILQPEMRERFQDIFHVLNPETGLLSFEQFKAILEGLGTSHVPGMLFRFFDRDHDGFVSVDDFFETHSIIITRGRPFLEAVFRAYTESSWYPGQALNHAARMFSGVTTPIRSPLAGPSPTASDGGGKAGTGSGGSANASAGPEDELASALAGLTMLTTPSRDEESADRPVSPIQEEGEDAESSSSSSAIGAAAASHQRSFSAASHSTTGPAAASHQRSWSAVSNSTTGKKLHEYKDIVPPPNYITARNVASMFERMGHDPEIGRKLFEAVMMALTQRGRRASASDLGPPVPPPAEASRAQSDAPVQGDEAAELEAAAAAAASTTRDGEEVKMTFEMFCDAVEVAPLLVDILATKQRKTLVEKLTQAMEACGGSMEDVVPMVFRGSDEEAHGSGDGDDSAGAAGSGTGDGDGASS